MPGPVGGLDPSMNRPIALRGADALPTRAPAEPAPLGPDVLFGSRYQPGQIGSFDVLDLRLKNSALSGTLASLADQQPEAIERAIRYDPATGGYLVRLYDTFGRATEIPVSRAEIADNIRRGGASANDDLLPTLGQDPVRNATSIWPAVIETAYAKVHDGNWNNGLGQGYAAIHRENSPDLVLHALTGSVGQHVGYASLPLLPKEVSLDILGGQVAQALHEGRSAVIETQPERRSLLDRLLGRPGPQDGLNDNQTLTVRSVHRDADGKWQVEIYKQTGYSPEQGGARQGFTVTVPLEKLVATGGLKDFVLGPTRDAAPGSLLPFPVPPIDGPIGPFPGGGLPDDPSARV